ncbi:hypothetical protein B7L44_15700 [Acinetobacter nosocomialis]|uniref:DUF4102 domain-containing protein n=1 Tax=Acinetobacter nosocomialis TaxID=106654 RepID=UPI0009E1216A|nr:hypothetical protein B7L44_15700 [Acinetobacter nosocomialis]
MVKSAGQKYWNVRNTVHVERKSESLGAYANMGLNKAEEVANVLYRVRFTRELNKQVTTYGRAVYHERGADQLEIRYFKCTS